ncbi:MAG: 16S rRNA (adenine(1518)-N(6)/adenine(1519)-N(6))-dimethyltransferase RsmA [Candidatus Firestonebacteria bacterium]
MNHLPDYYPKPKKRLGQHFLIDKNIINIIISSAEIKKEDIVLEIGAGKGELTEYLCKICNVIAVEIDKNLSDILREKFQTFNNVKIIQNDILKIKFEELTHAPPEGARLKIIGNIPYYITTPVLFKLIENKKYLDTVLLMVQKEIAKRIVSKSGNKDYGVLSIMTQYHTEPKIVKIVSNNCFYPKPKVDSAIVKFRMLDKPKYKVEDENLFINLVRASFQQRRKIFKSALLRLGYEEGVIKNIFNSLKLDLKIRGEDLSIEQFIAFSNLLKIKKGSESF